MAPAPLLHTLVHLERLCSPSGFHMLVRSSLHAAAIVPGLESPQSAWNHCSKQSLDGIIKNIFPNTRWNIGADLQFCLHEGLSCCVCISRLDRICNDLCLCSNRKVRFQLRWVLPALASAYKQRNKCEKENKMDEDAAAWVWACVSKWNMSLWVHPKHVMVVW